jgi:small RNA 2'-O-methyltransferase
MTMLTALHQQRLARVAQALSDSGASRVMDLGCGSGGLLSLLLGNDQFTRILGMDHSHSALEVVRGELLNGRNHDRLDLVHGSWTDSHACCQDYQAAALVETIEHLDPRELSRMESCIFADYGLQTIVVTTPNGEYNTVLGMAPGEMRDPDHRFEWSRARFRKWCRGVAGRHGYRVRFVSIGDEDPDFGPPTQMAVFVDGKTGRRETGDGRRET